MKTILVSIISVLVFISCSSSPVKVSTDHDEFANFKKLKTYKWYERDELPPGVDDLLHRRIVRNINRELVIDGYRLAEEGEKVDFLVNYAVVSKEKQEIHSVTSYSGYSPHYYGRHYYPSYHARDIQLRTYHKGTLFIDIISAKTDKLIWRGVGTRRIPPNMDRLRRNEIVREVVTEVMNHFPPDPKDKPIKKEAQ